MTLEELTVIATQEIEEAKPMYKQVIMKDLNLQIVIMHKQ